MHCKFKRCRFVLTKAGNSVLNGKIMENLTFNGQSVKSKTVTELASNGHSVSMLINGHLIQGCSKEDCIVEFERSPLRYDNSFKNSVEYFYNI